MFVEEVNLFELDCSSLVSVVFCDGLAKLSGLVDLDLERAQ